MNKNATLMSHLQNAAIVVLTVTAVLLLIQTPLVGDLAGKTPYELAQDWLAGDTSTDTAVTTDLTELALPVRVVFTNEYARYGLSAITTLDTDFELAGAFFGEALGSATTYEACSGEKLLTALHASSIYLDLEAPTPLEVLSRILGVNDAPESSLLRVTRLVLWPAENGATLYLQDADQGFFVSRTAGHCAKRSPRSMATAQILRSRSPANSLSSRPTRSFSANRRSATRSRPAMPSPIRRHFCALRSSTPTRKAATPTPPATPSSKRSTARCALSPTAASSIRARTRPRRARSTMSPPPRPASPRCSKPSRARSASPSRCFAT
mgnify:CR=1 FL=1